MNLPMPSLWRGLFNAQSVKRWKLFRKLLAAKWYRRVHTEDKPQILKYFKLRGKCQVGILYIIINIGVRKHTKARKSVSGRGGCFYEKPAIPVLRCKFTRRKHAYLKSFTFRPAFQLWHRGYIMSNSLCAKT